MLQAACGRSITSLAGGLPAESTFPAFPGFEHHGWEQYGVSEGDRPLRIAVSQHLMERGLTCPAERILILNGSQQGLDLAAKLFLDTHTPVLCESPTYVAALQVFRLFGATLHGLPMTHQGPEPSVIATALEHSKAHMAYVIPNYQNPTGAVWSNEARESLANACDKTGTVVLEDDPYGEIGFGDPLPAPVCSRLKAAPWMFLGSFSKSFVPGLRMGFLAASPELFAKLELLKQAADLHSNRLSQALVLADLQDPNRPRRLDEVRAQYRKRRDQFAESLHRHFPDAVFQAPEGGLFFWARLSKTLDLRTIAPRAMQAGVAFLPGEHCFPDKPELGWARLNFSHAAPDAADAALKTLAGLMM
jgi:2-aminoadipate transaminase